MMTQKLILKATAVLTLVGLTGGLLVAEQPKKNEQFIYRFVKGTANGFGKAAAYTAQTKINFWRKALKNPAVSFTLGAFVVAPVLRQTLFSVTPETNVKALAQKIIANNIHDAKKMYENAGIGYAKFLQWSAPKAEMIQNAAKQAAEKATEVKKQAADQCEVIRQNETLQKSAERAQEAGKNASAYASEKVNAFAQWIKDQRK